MPKLRKEDIDRIIDRVESGERVTDIAAEYGVIPKTIYYHLEKGASEGRKSLSNAQLAKENHELKLILAETMLELDKEKKRKVQNVLKKYQ